MTLRYDAPKRGANAGRNQSGTSALWSAVDAHWPSTTFLGIYARRSTANGSPSCHAEGRALDIGITGAVGFEIAKWLVANADALGVQVVIWNHYIWSVSYNYWRQYGCDRSGSPLDHHTGHVHVEQNWDGARTLTVPAAKKVLPVRDTPAPHTPPQEDDDMQPMVNVPTIVVTEGGGWCLFLPHTAEAVPLTDELLAHYRNLGVPEWKKADGSHYRVPQSLLDFWFKRAS